MRTRPSHPAQQNLAQLMRFAFVGVTVALFYVGLFTLLRTYGLGEALANSLAFAAAICLQYLGQTILTFRQPLAEASQVLRFGLTVGLGFVISALVTGIVGPSLGWADWVSASLVAVILPVQNFLLFRLWVYTGTAA